MATFKETREILLASYASNIITIEEYALLFEENSSNNLDFPYYNYPPFNLESQSEAECRANFRVEKHHIPLVEDALQIPQYFVCTWLLVDMEFLFSCSTRHLTRSLRSLVSYRVKHSKINSISTRAYVLFPIYCFL